MENGIIIVGSDGWVSLLGEIAAKFSDGQLISHEWLKDKFGLKKLTLKDFETVEDFLDARDNQQWSYMQLVDSLRWQLLENYKAYLRNIRGDGYIILQPQDQTQYGYDHFVSDMKKAFKEAGLIMNNVQPVDSTQQAKDNDLRAKFGMLKQMLSYVKL